MVRAGRPNGVPRMGGVQKIEQRSGGGVKMAASSHRVIFMGVGFKKKNLCGDPFCTFFWAFPIDMETPARSAEAFF